MSTESAKKEGTRKKGGRLKEDSDTAQDEKKLQLSYSKSQEKEIGTKVDVAETGTTTEEHETFYAQKRNQTRAYGNRPQATVEVVPIPGNEDESGKPTEKIDQYPIEEDQSFMGEVGSTDYMEAYVDQSQFSIYPEDLMFGQRLYPMDNYTYDMQYMAEPEGEVNEGYPGVGPVYPSATYGNQVQDQMYQPHIVYDGLGQPRMVFGQPPPVIPSGPETAYDLQYLYANGLEFPYRGGEEAGLYYRPETNCGANGLPCGAYDEIADQETMYTDQALIPDQAYMDHLVQYPQPYQQGRGRGHPQQGYETTRRRSKRQ